MTPTPRLTFTTAFWLALALAASPVVIAANADDANPKALDVEAAVVLAFARSEVQAAWQAAAAQAESEPRRAAAWANPVLGATQERIADSPGTPTERSLVLSQTFDVSGRRGLDIEAARERRSALGVDLAAQRSDLRAEVLRQFHATSLAEAAVDDIEAQRAVLVPLVAAAERRREAGDLSALEQRRISLRLAELEIEHLRRIGERAHARARLGGLLGVDLDAVVLVPTTLPATLPAALNEATAASGPSLATRRLEAQRDAAAARLRATQRWPLPVTVGAGLRRTEIGGLRDEAVILELSMPLPVFENRRGEREDAALALAQAERGAAESAREDGALKQALRDDATRLLTQALQLREQRLPAAARMAASARLAYSEGEVGAFELIDALDAEAALVDAALDLEFRAQLALVELQRRQSHSTDTPTE